MNLKLLTIIFVLFIFQIGSAQNIRPNILFAFADDMGKYASCYTNTKSDAVWQQMIQTPNIDRMANEGVLFNNAFVNAPSCTPCRSSLLSGQYFYRTGRGAILQGAIWDESIPTYPLLLEKNGYHIGFTYKVWSPGTPRDAGYGGDRTRFEPAGRKFCRFSQNATELVNKGKTIDEAKQVLLNEVRKNFQVFLDANSQHKPFCYWFGPTNTHRKWTAGSGEKLWNINPDLLKGNLPDFLPDNDTIREDFADYLGEVMAFDAGLGVLLSMLEERGELENTLVVISGDHGIPGFTNGKCNLYDFGTNVPLVIRYPELIPGKRVVDDLVSLIDLAPTFLEIGGVDVPAIMNGNSLWPLLKSNKNGATGLARKYVITGRERHVAKARAGNLPYPQRAIRTDDFLLIMNFKPERWPMGTPAANEETFSFNELANNTFITSADMDASPTKAWLVQHKNYPEFLKYYNFAFAKRPEIELYNLKNDPFQVTNLTNNPDYKEILEKLKNKLLNELKLTGDPRLIDGGSWYENPPFAGE